MNYLKEWTEKARVDGQIIINGVEYAIKEIIAYHCGTEKWVNIVVHDATGREVAVEAVEGETKLTLWQQISAEEVKTDDTFASYTDKTYLQTEKGRAQAIVKTEEGTDSESVLYRVFIASHRQRIAVEIWNKQIYCYVADVAAPKISFA